MDEAYTDDDDTKTGHCVEAKTGHCGEAKTAHCGEAKTAHCGSSVLDGSSVPDGSSSLPGAGYPAAGPGAGCRLPGRPFFGKYF